MFRWGRVASLLWRFRWVWILNLFLLSPVLWYELRVGQGGPDRTLLFVLPASLLWLATAHLALRSVWLTHVLLFPFYVTTLTDLYVIAHYQTRLNSSTLLVILENGDDAAEYVRSHLRDLAPPGALFVASYWFCLSRIRSLEMRVPWGLRLLVVAGVLGLYAAAARQVGALAYLPAQDRNSPFGVIPQSYVARLVYADAVRQAKAARGFSFGAHRVSAPAEPEAYVLVIGESARPDHFGINGYERDTTPELGKTANLVTFRDAISQIALTRTSVPLILTRGTVEAPSRTAGEKSVVSAFREAGFSTHWLSTQQRDLSTGAVNRYSAEAASQRFFERRHDGVLVEHLARVLSNPTEKKLFVVVHMMGSHFEYESRYPDEFDVFPTRNGGPSGRERLVNAYDNTVRYSDFVLSELILLLRERNGIKALFYVSDHGENLEDDERHLFGHYTNNEYDLPIAMFFWYSSEFLARYPEKVSSARQNAGKPVTTRTAFHTLLDMGSISIGDPATETSSLLSHRLSPGPRMVWRESGPVDFDRWLVGERIRASSLPRPRHDAAD